MTNTTTIYFTTTGRHNIAIPFVMHTGRIRIHRRRAGIIVMTRIHPLLLMR